MSIADQYDEYTEAFDTAYDALHEATSIANTTASITPPVLYEALGNLSAIAGFLQQILPSLARSARTGGQQLELYDSEGGNPAQQLESTTQILEDAAIAAGQLRHQLQAAHSEIASVGYRD